MTVDRRRFLQGSFALGTTGLIACGDDPTAAASSDAGVDGSADADTGIDAGNTDAGDSDVGDTDAGIVDAAADIVDAEVGPSCIDAFSGGLILGELVWVNATEPHHVAVGRGHDGRLYTDLSLVDHDIFTIPNENFYIRTLYPDLIEDTDVDQIRLHGLVENELSINAADIVADARPMGVQVLECSGNFVEAGFGLLSAADWEGVPLSEVLSQVTPTADAVGILVSGFDRQTHVSTHSTPSASWIFTFEQIERWALFLASSMNGVPLPPNHGAPVRLLAPNWFGCCNIKWVNEIRFVGADEPATPQMMEFAGRTHQPGVPSLAADYEPATMQQAAMPVRVDRYRLADGNLAFRVVGILWGGETTTDALEVRFGNGPWEAVDVCPEMSENAAWTIWEHFWQPEEAGDYDIRCRIADSSIPTVRLDSGRYTRTAFVDSV
ncbi:MAG: DMSO/TMAO reductase YedYZ molybdopterin-dependent catalytic subunit [Bradymonadia bacterium]|jgi:DMSO/TMAO reductase YedYZ molybdopterin-dependent catalytic subunit